MADKLTPRQTSVLRRIGDGLRKNGYPPTFRDIGEAEGIRSTNGVRSILEALQTKGYIIRERYRSRAIELTEPGREVAFGPRDGQAGSPGARIVELSDMIYPTNTVVEIPIYGEAVAAGAPLLAENNLQGHIAIDADYAPKGETFALRVKGESMIEVGINDGDVIFCRKQDDARPGEIIVALIGDEATVKYYHPGSNQIELRPANQYMQPIVVDPTREDFMILGIVVSLFRRY